ncbi:GTP-binding protein [Elusimicrobium simillimum]|uniref:GTPase ObgE n=1 Tax=Elusimicrobium simillimum TaxID=3143438 RepID=UPI003C6F55D5
MSFLDRVKIYVKAGKGGDGCLSFRREKFIEFGGPNGGNGGKGGDVYIKTERNLTTLLELAYNPHIEAQDGEKGGTYNKFGVGGEDHYIYVPCGTIVKKDGVIIADLTEEGEVLKVAEGGRGGRGNQSFKSHANTAPRISEIGQPGEEIVLYLELKVLADLGLVGFPNAGKSTFLSRVSAARPKIADYPFTTLNPNLGIAMHKKVSFAIADIPGIIEGASEGKGLGHQFLKHIERTRVLLHLVDPMGFKDADAVESVKIIEKELKSFDRELAKKPRIIAVNKADLPEAKEVYAKIVKKYKKHKIFLISAATGEGVNDVLDEIVKVIATTPVPKTELMRTDVAVHGVEPMFRVGELDDGRIQIYGRKIEDMVAMTHFNQPEGVERLRKTFKKIGLEKALLKKGITPGDIIVVGEKEFEWSGTDLDNDMAEQPDFAGYKRRTTQAERLAKRKERRLKKALNATETEEVFEEDNTPGTMEIEEGLE